MNSKTVKGVFKKYHKFTMTLLLNLLSLQYLIMGEDLKYCNFSVWNLSTFIILWIQNLPSINKIGFTLKFADEMKQTKRIFWKVETEMVSLLLPFRYASNICVIEKLKSEADDNYAGNFFFLGTYDWWKLLASQAYKNISWRYKVIFIVYVVVNLFRRRKIYLSYLRLKQTSKI